MENFRIHAAIGIARVGNSNEHVIAPESMTGAPLSGASDVTGGLPIRAGTESEPVRSSDLRDIHGALKRHAARFRIFAYPDLAEKRWPRGGGQEIVIGSTVGDNTVIDIVWTVHVAKKKTTTFILPEAGRQRIASYSDGHLPPIRNPSLDKPHAPLTTDRDLSDDYATAVQARFSEYLINRNHFDDLERRWPDSAFWARRQARLDLAGVA